MSNNYLWWLQSSTVTTVWSHALRWPTNCIRVHNALRFAVPSNEKIQKSPVQYSLMPRSSMWVWCSEWIFLSHWVLQLSDLRAWITACRQRGYNIMCLTWVILYEQCSGGSLAACSQLSQETMQLSWAFVSHTWVQAVRKLESQCQMHIHNVGPASSGKNATQNNTLFCIWEDLGMRLPTINMYYWMVTKKCSFF